MAVFGWIEPTSLLVLIFLATVIAVLLFRTQMYFRSNRGDRFGQVGGSNEASGATAHGANLPTAMAQWEVEMHETARRLSAQLDTKMGLLEHLIREADRAAARLEAALAAQEPRQDVGAGLSVPGPTSAGEPDRPTRPLGQAEGLRTASSAQQGTRALTQSDSSPCSVPPTPRPYEEIYTLADYGLEPAEIAQRVGTPVGEVQLILQLRKSR